MNEGYARFARGGALLVKLCSHTGLAVDYPRERCGCCWKSDFDVAFAAMPATIASVVWYRRQYDPAFAPPYNVAVARLAEGLEVLGILEGVHAGAAPCGARVDIRADDGVLFFRLAP